MKKLLYLLLAVGTLATGFAPGVALAQEGEEAAEGEEEAPRFLLGDIGVKINLDEERTWAMDYWSDNQFKAKRNNDVFLFVWVTPFQVPFTGDTLEDWGTTYTRRGAREGGVEPTVRESSMGEVQGIEAGQFIVDMKSSEDVPLVLHGVGFPVPGHTLHFATIGLGSAEAEVKAALDEVVTKLEIQSKPPELPFGGEAKANVAEGTLPDHFRKPLLPTESAFLVNLAKQQVGRASVGGCVSGVHPLPNGKADLLLICQDKKTLGLLDEYTFADRDAELREAWFTGMKAEPAQTIALGDRTALLYDVGLPAQGGKPGPRAFVGAVRNDKGLAKLWVVSGGTDHATLRTQAEAALKSFTFSKPPEIDFRESVIYYLQYRPTDPVVIGPAVGIAVVILLLIVFFAWGIRRQMKIQAEMQAELDKLDAM